jgi:hypothetical protein
MRRIVTALFILLSAAAAPGVQGGPEGWIKYTSREGRYSVMMPREPTLSAQDTTPSTGVKLKQYLAQASDSNSLVMIGYFDHAADVSFNFDKGRDGMVNAIKGTLISESAISLGGNPGRELKVVAKAPDGNEFMFRARYYSVRGRVYGGEV